jgi:HD superfamily phosphohydrolase YqeK
MKKEQLEGLKEWFDGFVAGFYGDDEYVNANIKLKEDHSRRVCEEMLYLANGLSLDEHKRLLAETIALLHDVGRFPQFVKYRTYYDPRSIDHCQLAVSVLREHRVLDALDPAEKQTILKAIEYHGLKELPENLDDDVLLFCRLIRDADKLDIYRVVTWAYTRHRDDPDNFEFEIELPDEPRYSPDIIRSVLNGEHIDYAKLQTWNDMKLINLAWVYDVNFIQTLKRIRERKLLETILSLLPDTEDIRRVRDKVISYVDSRIARPE